MPPEARARVDEVTRLVVEKLLVSPTERLKSLDDETMVTVYSEALNRLFSLDSTGIPHNDHGRTVVNAHLGPHRAVRC